jgi:hypothetical protein
MEVTKWLKPSDSVSSRRYVRLSLDLRHDLAARRTTLRPIPDKEVANAINGSGRPNMRLG